MLLFLLRRLGAGLVLVFVIATLTFFLTNLTGSDPARRILGNQASPGRRSRPSGAELGLDRPVLSRYGTGWPAPCTVTWDRRGSPSSRSTRLIASALPVSLSLVLAATAPHRRA